MVKKQSWEVKVGVGVVRGGIDAGVDEDGGDDEEGVVGGGVGVGVDGEEAELGGVD